MGSPRDASVAPEPSGGLELSNLQEASEAGGSESSSPQKGSKGSRRDRLKSYSEEDGGGSSHGGSRTSGDRRSRGSGASGASGASALQGKSAWVISMGFFDAEALDGKTRRQRVVWRLELLVALCKHLLKTHSEDAILTFECMAAIYVIFMVPFQLAWHATDVLDTAAFWRFNYCIDFLQLTCAARRLRAKLPKHVRENLDRMLCTCCPSFVQPRSMHETAKERRERKKQAQALNDEEAETCNWTAVRVCSPSAIRLLCYLPVDGALWYTDDADVCAYVPYIRLTRLLVAPGQVLKVLGMAERSQAITFVLARSLRLVFVLALTIHLVSCTFIFVARQQDAEHYDSAPWYTPDTGEANRSFHYLRALYWALITVTTVGHVDVPNRDGTTQGARQWEFITAIFLCVAASALYIYVTSNLTSMMLRFYTDVESYRSRIGAISGYLQKHRIERRLRQLVYHHFNETYTSSGKSEKHLLSEMPHSLRREVLKQINMRVLRKVTIFFGCEVTFLRQLCHALQRVTFIPSEEIAVQGDMARELYFIDHGRVQGTMEPPEEDYDSEDMEEWEIEIREREFAAKTVTRVYRYTGTPLCTLSFLFGLRQEESLKAIEKTSCLMLPREEYNAVASEFPADIFKMRKKALDLAKELYGDDKTVGMAVAQEVEAILAKKGSAIFDMLVAVVGDQEDQVRIALNSTSSTNTVGVDDPGFEGRTALHLAAGKGYLGMTKLLLDLGASPSLKDADQRTPLQAAVFKGHVEVSKVLRNAGATLGWDEVTTSGELCEAAKAGNLEKLELILSSGASVNAADYDKRTCMHLAASTGIRPVVAFLLKRHADLSVKDRWGGTALSDAVREGNLECAELLRDAGGELGYDELTASGELCDSARKGQVEHVKMLLKCGADVNAADYDLRTCAHLAASEGNMHITEVLVAREEINLNLVDRFGSTPLSDALRGGHLEVARFLVTNGGQVVYDDLTASGELCEFARSGKLERIQLLLEGGCNVDACDYDGRTCLHLAASTGNMLVVQGLHAAGANLSPVDGFGGTPLSDAIRNGHLEVARLLIKHEAQVEMAEEAVASMLCDLARKGDVEKMRTLCSANVDPNACDYDKRSAMHLAACVGIVIVVDVLVSFGADPNCCDRWGNTPLSEAIHEGHKKVAGKLYEHGGRLGWSDSKTASEMCEFARNGDLERIKMLCSLGCNVNAADYDGRTCLHVAASAGNKLIVSALLEAGGELSLLDHWEGTPLSDAVRQGHRDIANRLIEGGATLSFEESRAAGELCELARSGDLEKVKLLLSGGCAPDSCDYDKRTCLHLASSVGNHHIVQALVEAKADLDFQDRWGGTALAEAVREGHTKVVVYLRGQGASLMWDEGKTSGELCEFARAGDVERVKIIRMASSVAALLASC